jgi:hypothetical protein
VIVDISQTQWRDFISKRLDLVPFPFNTNKTRIEMPVEYTEQVHAFMHQAMDELGVSQDERSSSFLLRSLLCGSEIRDCRRLLSLYANNLPKSELNTIYSASAHRTSAAA